MDISGKDVIVDNGLTLLEFYRYDQFFEKYLEKMNLTKNDFFRNLYNKTEKNTFLEAIKIKNDALNEYKEKYPDDYKKEVQYQTAKIRIRKKENNGRTS
jgi:hypothetical protein